MAAPLWSTVAAGVDFHQVTLLAVVAGDGAVEDAAVRGTGRHVPVRPIIPGA
jgi:hypothetical protein